MNGFGVWDPDPVPLPEGKNSVDTKWVFRVKRDQDGRVAKYKARLVARGFTQQWGTDFDETYSSVAKLGTIRILLAIAAVKNWEVEVVDVDNAFLNAPLKEEVYLDLPEGLGGGGAGLVLKLNKALYGLKQSPRTWEKELGAFLETKGFKQCMSDSALYTRTTESGGTVHVPVFVDDLLLVGETKAVIQAAKDDLKEGYKVKELGEVSIYLGIEITRDRRGRTLSLGLPNYISELETKYSKHLEEEGSKKSVGSPMTPETMKRLKAEEWTEEESREVDRKQFMSVLGSLMFAALTCRPDLAYSVSLLSQAGVDPRVIHMDAIVRVLKYLIHTKQGVLVYQGEAGTTQPCVYTDSDWGSERDGLSRAAWTVKVAGGAVTWFSKKLPLVATSSTEAEYKALSEGGKDVMWYKGLMGELGISLGKVTIYCDNQSAIQISRNPVQHFKTRHFKLSKHLIRQLQEAGEVAVEFVRTGMQDADVLTKALTVGQHLTAVRRLGLHL